MLNKAAVQRVDTYSPAIAKEGIKPEYPKINKESSRVNLNWTIDIVLFILLVLNIALTFSLFVTVKQYTADKKDSVKKLEEMITNNNRSINKINDSLETVNKKTKNMYSKVEQIQETTDAQAVAIKNLTRAQNTLFNKVSALEAEIQ
jgi:methyl-accepting chemotaxis protein